MNHMGNHESHVKELRDAFDLFSVGKGTTLLSDVLELIHVQLQIIWIRWTSNAPSFISYIPDCIALIVQKSITCR